MKRYTFRLSVSCHLALTLSRKELQQWPDGREGDLEPRDDVMDRIEQRLTELISQEFDLTDRISLYTDGDLLLGVVP